MDVEHRVRARRRWSSGQPISLVPSTTFRHRRRTLDVRHHDQALDHVDPDAGRAGSQPWRGCAGRGDRAVRGCRRPPRTRRRRARDPALPVARADRPLPGPPRRRHGPGVLRVPGPAQRRPRSGQGRPPLPPGDRPRRRPRAGHVDDLEVRPRGRPVRRREGRRHLRSAGPEPEGAGGDHPALRPRTRSRSSARTSTSPRPTSGRTPARWPGSWTPWPSRAYPARRS